MKTPTLQGLAKQPLPTLCSRDERGPSPKQTKGGRNLPREAGGHLSPEFCEWLMGFPVGHTAPMIGLVLQPSGTRARRNRRKPSATSSASSSKPNA